MRSRDHCLLSRCCGYMCDRLFDDMCIWNAFSANNNHSKAFFGFFVCGCASSSPWNLLLSFVNALASSLWIKDWTILQWIRMNRNNRNYRSNGLQLYFLRLFKCKRVRSWLSKLDQTDFGFLMNNKSRIDRNGLKYFGRLNVNQSIAFRQCNSEMEEIKCQTIQITFN